MLKAALIQDCTSTNLLLLNCSKGPNEQVMACDVQVRQSYK